MHCEHLILHRWPEKGKGVYYCYDCPEIFTIPALDPELLDHLELFLKGTYSVYDTVGPPLSVSLIEPEQRPTAREGMR